jgi:hypothetical protein
MLKLRKASERGHANHGWLDSYHTFSFADYHDPAHMGFRALRVINDDRVAAGAGFPPHSHRDMEIITYVLDGALEHRDNLGNGSVIRPGDVQRMTAGTGVVHSEYNHSRTAPVHLLQIWLLPERRGISPGYQEASFSDAARRGILRKVASRDGSDGSVTVHQDVDLYATLLDPAQTVRHLLRPDRHAWLQLARGHASINGHSLDPGDGVAITAESDLVLTGAGSPSDLPAELLLFDLA